MSRRIVLLFGLALSVVGGWLYARSDDAPSDAPRTTAAFELNEVPDGSVVLDLRGGSLQDEEPSAVAKARTQTGVIEGRVLDADGTPLAGAVVVGGEDLTAIGELLQADDGTRTDAEGRFELKTYGAAEIVLLAAHEERGMSSAARLRVGEDARLELQPFTWIEGFVREGERVTDARVFVRSADRHVSYIGRTDASGHYMLGPLPPGTYEVTASEAGARNEQIAYPVRSVRLEPGTTTTHDVIESDTGAVRIDYRRTPGMHIATVGVALFEGSQEVASDAAYQRLLRESSPGSVHATSTVGDSDEYTVFKGLPPGPYTACARANLGSLGMRVTCEQFTLDDAERIDVDLRSYAG